jgi:P27 family predicted phage terminase small subunit
MKGRPTNPSRHEGLKPLAADRFVTDTLPRVSCSPPAPCDLEPECVDLWDALAAELVMLRAWHDSDATLLRRCVMAAWRAQQAERLIDTHGPLVKGLHGPIVNPALKIERDSTALFVRLAETLGLTPTARMRLGLQRLGATSILAEIALELDAVR